MHPLVINAYNALGYKVHVGNNMSFSAKILDADNNQVDAGGGMCVEDISFWMFLSTLWHPNSMYIIGNAFGYSALNMAAIFPQCKIDVIDAEIEGHQNQEGSKVTKKIAKKHFKNLELFIGFSPQDIPLCRRHSQQTYDCCIVDGLHHPEQLKKDFIGIKQYLNNMSLVYFHDAGTFNLYSAIEELAEEYKFEGWQYYKLDFVPFGVGVLCRNVPTIQKWMDSLLTPIKEWRNTPATDNAACKPGNREPLIYNGNLYNPTPFETNFCPNAEINALRLALLYCNRKDIIIYGARGRLANDVIEFLDNNYRDIELCFVDRALTNSKIRDKWDVVDNNDPRLFDNKNVIIAAEMSGRDIYKFISDLNTNATIFPLYEVNNKIWKETEVKYLRRKSKDI